MRYSISLILIFVFTYSFSQNVGVGVTSPLEKLDVNGNINVSGTIKANGLAGSSGQSLMTNGAGNLVWAYPGEFKNFITFSNVGNGSWIVPAGVTKIYVEVWAGGGGGTGTGGGGGGGYIAGILMVSPGGTVSYTVGEGGASGSPNASNGGLSQVSYPGSTLMAMGGAGNAFTSFGNAALGGGFNANSGSPFIGKVGEDGGINTFSSYQTNSTTFFETQTGGKGGDGANTQHTGGKGTYQVRNAGTQTPTYTVYGSTGKIPGGGGGGNVTWGGIVRSGAHGLVIIHF